MPRRRILRNIILPTALLVSLLWLMTGCFYFPFFEHRLDNGPNPRAMVGPADSGRPIRPRQITREEVHAMFGAPTYAGNDAASEGYLCRTSYGTWVAPLCFGAERADEKAYIVRLNYDSHGLLKSYDWVDAYRSLGLMSTYSTAAEDEALVKINQSGPPLIRIRK